MDTTRSTPFRQRNWSCWKWIGAALVACALLLPAAAAVGGSWVTLAHQPPETTGTMLLLSDGTVMAQGGGGGNASAKWYKLTPDSTGGYTNGQWTTLRSMHCERVYYSSDVLQNGTVFVAGGEYGIGTTNAEIYDPLNDSWSIVPIPPGIIYTNLTPNLPLTTENDAGFVDSSSIVLNNGDVLILPVFGYTNGQMVIYNPNANTWGSNFLVHYGFEDEETLLKLPDDSIMLVNFPGGAGRQQLTKVERYFPSLNVWREEQQTCPVQLYDETQEQGPAFLLPNGNGFFIGANPVTAIYVPSGSTKDGSWIVGPNIPQGLCAPDSPAAMMPNGKILCALVPSTSNPTNQFTDPTSFYEYDYTVGTTGAFTPIEGPNNSATDSSFQGGQSYVDRMLDLPDGTVLFSDGSQSYVYIPGGAPVASGKPVIDSITANSDGSFHLAGTGLNGISQGAGYGDDAQMDSNYPIIRLTDSEGKVTYGRTYNWSSTSVQTGSRLVSTEFTVPLDGGSYSLQAIANGIASDPVSFSGPVWVDFNYSGDQIGTFLEPFETLRGGVDFVANFGTIFIKAGVQPSISSETLKISKPMTILSVGGPSTIGQ